MEVEYNFLEDALGFSFGDDAYALLRVSKEEVSVTFLDESGADQTSSFSTEGDAISYLLQEGKRLGDPSVTVEMVCPMCGKSHTYTVPEQKVMEYIHYLESDLLIQDALASFTPYEREFFKSGYCQQCQSKLFGVKKAPKKLRDLWKEAV